MDDSSLLGSVSATTQQDWNLSHAHRRTHARTLTDAGATLGWYLPGVPEKTVVEEHGASASIH